MIDTTARKDRIGATATVLVSVPVGAEQFGYTTAPGDTVRVTVATTDGDWYGIAAGRSHGYVHVSQIEFAA